MEQTQRRYDPSALNEAWIAEWIEFGFREMAAYLRRHAAFDDYYRRRRHATGGTSSASSTTSRRNGALSGSCCGPSSCSA
jgi:hypothetical protein